MNDLLAVTTLRCLSLDMIDKANSGHPGMALGSAPIMHTLFTRHINANPNNPKWIKRDRFVLSSGHVSSLLYSTLHVAGYNLSLDDLKQFRQYGSKTPGHPEYGVTEGVDISTGPLGQGIANAVGMAMAETHLCALYPNFKDLLSHYTYVLCGDGDLEEGIALEAMALAGLYKLNKLIVCYDNNDVTLDGPLAQSAICNTKQKVEAMGWNVLEVSDGNDVEAIDKAICKAKESLDKPTMIIVKTIIGYGSLNQGTSKVHGAPLKKEGTDYVKKAFNFIHDDFYVPEEVKDAYKNSFVKRGLDNYKIYENSLNALNNNEKELFIKILNSEVYADVNIFIPSFEDNYSNGTRNASGIILNDISNHTDLLFGGCADVAGSVMTALANKTTYDANNRIGQNLNYGIREHAMCAIANGIAAHGGLRPYVGCFLVFSDYARGAIRMASLMKLPVIYLFSHDSIAVGEDGPTHEPIEQMSSLRLLPNFNLIRPADARETAGAYKLALSSKETPTAIILSRQKLVTEAGCDANSVANGAYIVAKENKKLDAIILATGSEVNLACRAKEELAKENIDVRVVSMPSTYLFELQSNSYKNSVLPDREKTIAVEMGIGNIWYKYAKKVMSIDKFGASGPANQVIEAYGFTVDKLVSNVKDLLNK